jgi:hypothetical protein
VWTSSTVTGANQDPKTKKWTVQIERANAKPRSFVVNHLVFAMGLAGGTHKVPQIRGAVRVYGHARHLFNSYLTSVVRTSSKALSCTPSITTRPKITKGRR